MLDINGPAFQFVITMTIIAVVIFSIFRSMEKTATGNQFWDPKDSDVSIAESAWRNLQLVEVVAILAAWITVIEFENQYLVSSLSMIVLTSSICWTKSIWRKFAFGFQLSAPTPVNSALEDDFEFDEGIFADVEQGDFEDSNMKNCKWLLCGQKVIFNGEVREVISRGKWYITMK